MSGEVTALLGAKVIIGDGTALDAADIVIEGERIVSVRPAGNLETRRQNMAKIDMTGATIMPTIINVHGHVGYLRGGSCGAENYSRDNVIDHLRRLAYYGVSVIQSLGTDRDATEIRIRDAQDSGDIDVSRMALLRTAGAGIAASSGPCGNGGAYFATDVIREIDGPLDAASVVADLATERPNVIKVWIDDRSGTKKVPDLRTVTSVVDEARKHGIPVVAHVFSAEDARKAVEAGADGLAHMIRTEVPDDDLLDAIASRDMYVCSSIGIQRNFLDDLDWLDEEWVAETVDDDSRGQVRSYFESMQPDERREISDVLPILAQQARALHERGIPLVLSCDTGLDGQFFGVAEHREIEAMAKAGIAPGEVLRAATSTGARLLGLSDRGTIAPGKRADLLVLSSDPLDDVTKTRDIAEVYLGGRRLDRTAMSAGWRTVASSSHGSAK